MTVWCRLFFIFLIAMLHGNSKAENNSYVLENVAVITGQLQTPILKQSVLIKGSIFSEIYPTGSKLPPSDITIIDLAGHTLMPGLINGHVHLTPNPNRQQALSEMVRMGITTVRDLGGSAPVLKELAQNDTIRPRLIFSAVFFGPGFLNDPRVSAVAGNYAPGEAPWMRLVTETSDIDQVVADAKEIGAGGIKIYASVSKAVIKKIVAAAASIGMPVWSHSVTFPADPQEIVLAGVNQIIHSKGLVALGRNDIPQTFREGVLTWTPKLAFAQINPDSSKFSQLFALMNEHNTVLEPALIADQGLLAKGKNRPRWMVAQENWACEATRFVCSPARGEDICGYRLFRSARPFI
ncbi:amidohydrolase family protein [Alteromonas ponticola]|uniref:Amidohydrolase family protein n=1 Tax=Alteromonas aquimaris TaxID=2998417 RepID=A0ABT3P6N4_9ALTE|nr:amidohydrolase family protein [Alteromonas aquimaris]MCW8108429.1 amidohydrolase family protein [Alteromonas aquimaris]